MITPRVGALSYERDCSPTCRPAFLRNPPPPLRLLEQSMYRVLMYVLSVLSQWGVWAHGAAPHQAAIKILHSLGHGTEKVISSGLVFSERTYYLPGWLGWGHTHVYKENGP